jgi:GAF domain-containing protein
MNTKLEFFRSALRVHRYTAIYQLRGLQLKNIGLYDKSGEIKPEHLDEVAFEASFCQFVLRDGLFRTENSASDNRLDGHPYQGVMLSYHGVPLLDDAGRLYGSLCHFDVTQHLLPDEDFEFLQRAARVLPAFLPRD